MQIQSIFDLIYLLVFLSYLLLSLFILYHIIRYSGDRAVMAFTIILFLIGTLSLLLANSLLFFSIPFDQFVPTLSLPSYQTGSPFNLQ